jgi:hypothetical protein
MKKLIVSILAILYITSSCEATVYLHYCMGRQVSFSFLPEHSGNCHRCGMKKSAKSMGCCRDEQKLLKSDPNQKLTDLSWSTDLQKKLFSTYTQFHTYPEAILFSGMIKNSPTHGPPGGHPVPFYLMNCFFLI